MSKIKARTPLGGAKQDQLPWGEEIDKKGELDRPSPPVVHDLQLGVTFKDSLKQGAFGWYPYVEGFSADYAREILRELNPKLVYDPFGGSGTTSLAAGMEGIPSFYCELNPLMRFVADVKTNGLAYLAAHKSDTRIVVKDYLAKLSASDFKKEARKVDLSAYHRAFPGRDFFVETDLQELLLCLEFAKSYEKNSPRAAEMLKLAVAANAVKSSNMTRRADLRRRRDGEYKNRVVDAVQFVSQTTQRMLYDVEVFDGEIAPSKCIGSDAKNLFKDFSGRFDCVLTSPPYLNGTNYFRNTKIELWLLGFIDTELDIRTFNKQAVAGGIDNVRGKSHGLRSFREVEDVASRIEQTDGDKRIPNLVRQYFSDMHEVMVSVSKLMHDRGSFVMDIGDSKFYGVHVPTDQLLIRVAEEVGLKLSRSKVLARRHSRDKSPLVQVELTFKKTK